jgi:signal transduction histidine kinase
MPGTSGQRGALRLPRRTLRIRLALLYAALFCVSAIALAAVALIFRPDFLMRTSCAAAPGTPSRLPRCGHQGQSVATITGTVMHDMSQNPAGVVMVAVMVVLAVGVGWLLAGRLVLPLRAITASARDISASNLHRRLGLNGHDDEFSELGQTLDDLFARLEASFESQRHFIANASHELRTPLTAGRALLQVAIADPEPSIQALRATCEELVDLTDQQERLIAALLTLADSQRGLEHPAPMDLADITQDVLLGRQHEADRHDVRLVATLAAAPATGDPSLAESLVANLVDNAIRHNRPGGQAEISTALTAGGAVITVGNTGPLIPPGDVEELFQPFRQLGTQRIRNGEGHGLGLAIVRAIADAHGATLTARVRPRGGLDIEVSFP